MIANARMYSVSAEAVELWRALLGAVIERAGVAVSLIDHAEPAPIEELWSRSGLAAVFMCGLPYSRTEPRPILLAAPVPAPAEFAGQARYWSNLVVRADSGFQSVPDTFGQRIAFTTPDSQSGCGAALSYFADHAERFVLPLFREIVAPQITPLGALKAVLDRDAEIAPIDSYAFYLLQRFRPDLTSQVRVIGKTGPTPIPPLIASPPGSEALQSAFLEAHRNTATQGLMERLMLQRFVRAEPVSYDVLRHNFEAASRYWNDHPLAAAVHPAFAAVAGGT